MSKFIMALDAGTTSNRCILFNEAGEICSMAQKEFRQMFPNPGWVEHDANEIWSTQLGVAVEAMSKIGATAADIAAIGITNQRETAIVWNKETGEPIYNAIVWQCRRTSDIADALKKKGLEDSYRKKTGLIIDAYFSATKIKWILDNVKGARKLAEEGKSAKEIKAILEADKLDSGIYIMVDTLKYLKKGGRVTAAGAAIGTVLGIKPVLQIHGEKLDAFAKTRGVKQAKKKTNKKEKKVKEEKVKRKLWKRIVTVILVMGIVAVIAVAGIFAYIALTTDKFDPNALKNQDQTVVYDVNGEVITKLGTEKRKKIKQRKKKKKQNKQKIKKKKRKKLKHKKKYKK